jgi:hypothetical protein
LDPIEKAIRNALEKGDSTDRAFREKVYRSAFSALDRALKANPNVTVESAINRRKTMTARIAEIEAEFLPAPAAAGTPAGANAAPSIDAPGHHGGSASDAHIVPVVPDIMPDAPLPRTMEPEPDIAPRRRRPRRRGLPALFAALTVLAVIALGAWWLLQSGALRTPEQRGEVPVPPATVEDEDFSPSGGATAPLRTGENGFSGEWITVFTPLDPTTVSTPSDAKADVMEDDSGTYLRVRSGSSGSAVSFDVGQGILDEVAGTRAVFVIVARGEGGAATQVSIDCNFGELGDCGRKRYDVKGDRGEYLFDVQFPDKRAGAAGTIAITSDVENQGRSVDIYEIRVSVAE